MEYYSYINQGAGCGTEEITLITLALVPTYIPFHSDLTQLGSAGLGWTGQYVYRGSTLNVKTNYGVEH